MIARVKRQKVRERNGGKKRPNDALKMKIEEQRKYEKKQQVAVIVFNKKKIRLWQKRRIQKCDDSKCSE